MLRSCHQSLRHRYCLLSATPSFSSSRFYASSSSSSSSSFTSRPAPPKLPADLQAEFERLQRAASVSSAFQPSTTSSTSPGQPSQTQQSHDSSDVVSGSAATSGALYKGAPNEFEGDKNPRTGEVGGPKKEPLRWGSESDWSYNGKVTDF